jgi:hypothetical protein
MAAKGPPGPRHGPTRGLGARNHKISHMSVVPGEESIHVVFENKEANTTTTFDMQKQSQ